MEIEIRLAKVLQDHDLDHHGVTQEIAEYCKVHRHTIGRIYHNRVSNPPLNVLGQICEWLQLKGVPAASLPAALFGAGARALWRAIAEPGAVTLFLGEYQQETGDTLVYWIARRDSAVETDIVRFLSVPANCGQHHPTINTYYVPFRAELGTQRPSAALVAKDRQTAATAFHHMQETLRTGSAILIGSQRANYVVEYFIADLFACDPFDPKSKPRVPFYMTFPRSVRSVTSTFGGLKNPPGETGPLKPGTHFLDDRGTWQLLPWTDGVRDSGVVIVCYDPGNKRCLLAVLGLTGRATEALGRYVTANDKDFWPATADSRYGKVGVFLCSFNFTQKQQGPGDTAVDKMQVIPMPPQVLRRHLYR
jgi:hypothetical protein